MGGHGGLNILPQKRWNVYNYDNRAKVERDRRRMHEKRNQENDKQMKNESNTRIQELRKKHNRDGKSRSNQLDKAVKMHEEHIQAQQNNEIANKKHKGVNLFSAEEEAQGKQLQHAIEVQSQKFFEGKPFEMDTKFGGNFKNQPLVPWYAQEKEQDGNVDEDIEDSEAKMKLKREIQDFRKNKRPLFKVIGTKLIDPKEENGDMQSDYDLIKASQRERKSDFKEKKDHSSRKEKKIKKEKKNKKKDKKKSKHEKDSKEQSEQLDLQKLRAECIKREQEERLRIRDLLRTN